MDDLDSINTLPPDFGPSYPDYPAIDSFVRTTGPALAGLNVYPAIAQQPVFSGGLPAFRDRETVWLFEPNGIVLGPGFYDARLIGSYPPGQAGAVPLYATVCCVSGKFSSSSSASSSSGQVLGTCLYCNAGVPIALSFTVSGVLLVLGANGTFKLPFESDCLWGAISQLTGWSAYIDGAQGILVLQYILSAAVVATYESDAGFTPGCSFPATVKFKFATEGANWPNSITINPA